MRGDKLIFLEKHALKAKTIFDRLQSDSRPKIIVVIGGGPGTGKSEIVYLTQELLLKTGVRSFSISLDDYYILPPEKRKDRKLADIGPAEIDWARVGSICRSFLGDKTTRLQEFDRFNQKFHSLRVKLDPPVLFIDGLYALYLKTITSLPCLGIYLEGTPLSTYQFRRLRGKENVDELTRKLIVLREFKEAKALKQLADVIL